MPDFSCYVTVNNNSPENLILASSSIVDGSWGQSPPGIINQNGGSGSWTLNDNAGAEGSEGFCTYSGKNSGANVSFHFSCPVWSSNNIMTATSSNAGILAPTVNSYNGGGHPLNATCTIQGPSFDADGAESAIPSKLLAHLQKDYTDSGVWKQVHKDLVARKEKM